MPNLLPSEDPAAAVELPHLRAARGARSCAGDYLTANELTQSVVDAVKRTAKARPSRPQAAREEAPPGSWQARAPRDMRVDLRHRQSGRLVHFNRIPRPPKLGRSAPFDATRRCLSHRALEALDKELGRKEEAERSCRTQSRKQENSS